MRGIRPYPIIIEDDIEKKECHWCHQFKPLDEFYKNTRYTHGLQPYCKSCFSAYFKKRNTKEKNRIDFLRKYGLTPELYDKMYENQGGKCAICGNSELILAVDHDHKIDKVRKLLCNNCNAGLGSFKEDVNILLKAIGYINEFKK